MSHPSITPLAGELGRSIHYYFFDLPLVRQLAQKYLSHFPWLDRHSFHFMESDWKASQPDGDVVFDLCISNYAFSELSTKLQDNYIASVIKRCKRGYMIYNTIGEDILGSYTVHDFSLKLLDSTMFGPIREMNFSKEFPGDRMNSTVFYWIGSF